jgi:glycosyltransferase involved in cell wall biosynthesis
VPPDDVDALVTAIERATATPAPALADMRQRARQFVESHHSKAQVVAQYVDLMGELEATVA